MPENTLIAVDIAIANLKERMKDRTDISKAALLELADLLEKRAKLINKISEKNQPKKDQ